MAAINDDPSTSESSRKKKTAPTTTNNHRAQKVEDDEWRDESEYVIDSFCLSDSDVDDGYEEDVSYELDARNTSSEGEVPLTVMRKLSPRSARSAGPRCSSPEPIDRMNRRLSFNSSMNSIDADEASPDKLLLKDLYPELDSREVSALLEANRSGTAAKTSRLSPKASCQPHLSKGLSIAKKEPTASSHSCSTSVSYEENFLLSLSPTSPASSRLREVEFFLGKSFKKNRLHLCAKLFRIFNETVFDSKLPADLPIEWNVRLRTTAGFCHYRRSPDLARTARIELSTKVCDTADRVRDTLIHELCHAAVFIIDGDVKDKHGPRFRHWGTRACCIYPDLPRVSRCHDYEIAAKFIYQCGRCRHQIKRHSKSLDIERQLCDYCGGRFILLVNGKPATALTPRTNKFAQFVKSNYGVVKTASKSHKDVMIELGEQFKSLSAT